jgi:hypothetical protein
MGFKIIIATLLSLSYTAYDDYSTSYPSMKAMFMEEWQCKQVKTNKEKCIRVDDKYVGLFDIK